MNLTSTALRTCCQVRCADVREHCAQLFQGYQATGGVLPADPDSHGRKLLRKICVHSASVCTRHGDELIIVNNGNEPWKRLCSTGATTGTGESGTLTFRLGTNNVLVPQLLGCSFQKAKKNSQQVVTRMQDLASGFS